MVSFQNWSAFGVALLLTLVTLEPVHAAPPPAPGKAAPPAADAKIQAYREARIHLQKLGQRLGKIEQAAAKANPDLQKEQEQFRQLLTKTMEKDGYDAEAGINRLREIQTKLGNQNLEQKKRQTLMTEFRQKSSELQRAQHKALQNPKVQEARAKLAKHTIAAMTKQDPETPKLIDEVKRTRNRLIDMQKQMSPH